MSFRKPSLAKGPLEMIMLLRNSRTLTTIADKISPSKSITSIPEDVLAKVGSNLLSRSSSPLSLVLRRISSYFDRYHNGVFQTSIVDNPVVTVKANFDDLLFPANHTGRSISDTYYINAQYLLRTHMTAHERDFIKSGFKSFIIAGDVYRRDEIDKTHYPVFHQVEGVRIFTPHEVSSMRSTTLDASIIPIIESQLNQHPRDCSDLNAVIINLHDTLNGLLKFIFGDKVSARWIEGQFPFTHPSMEVEIDYDGKAVEILGCGILQENVIKDIVPAGSIGWAFGLGLERLAMLLYKIPDIRLFWCQDPRFADQFCNQTEFERPRSFIPFSRYPPVFRDVSFFINERFSQNFFFDWIRDVAGDLVESVVLIDKYEDKVSSLTSLCYRLCYRSMVKTLTDQEVNIVHDQIRRAISSQPSIVRLR